MTPSRTAFSIAATLAVAANAMAASAPATEATKLSSQYSDWAGGRSNAESLVAGLRNAAPITLVTSGPDHSASIAGFTPSAPLSYDAVKAALSNAQRSLARVGVSKPNAEQIQAALIGGEVKTARGGTAVVKGSIASRGAGPLASR
ncbi:MAG: hypothetical protein ACXWG1_13205 [Usitatibacter sp.]